MPWCPVCKNEYKDGYTLCADCGAELVAFLETDEKTPEVDVIPEATEMISEQEILEEVNIPEMDAEALAELTKHKSVNERTKPFVKATDRAAEYKSSAYALLIVGIAGAAFLILSYLKVIPINLAANINALFYIVMGIMFAAFIIMGIKSFSAAKVIADTADDEDALTAKIYAYFKEYHSETTIDELSFEDGSVYNSDEEKFFPRSNCIRNIIIEKFGELDEAYLTELTETIYSDIYEK